MSYRRKVHCRHCGETGHNRNGCAKLKEYIKNNPNSWSAQQAQQRAESVKHRKCSYCKEGGHTRRSCKHRKQDIVSEAEKVQQARKVIAPLLEEHGIGTGALLEFEGELYTVESFAWHTINHGSIIGENNGTHAQPLLARSFPCETYPRGYVRHFNLPVNVRNPHDLAAAWHEQARYTVVSQAPTASLPADFAEISVCRKHAEGMDKFNDGLRPYEYRYPEG